MSPLDPPIDSLLSERLTPEQVSEMTGLALGTLANRRSMKLEPDYYRLRVNPTGKAAKYRVYYLRSDVERWMRAEHVRCYPARR